MYISIMFRLFVTLVNLGDEGRDGRTGGGGKFLSNLVINQNKTSIYY